MKNNKTDRVHARYALNTNCPILLPNIKKPHSCNPLTIFVKIHNADIIVTIIDFTMLSIILLSVSISESFLVFMDIKKNALL